MLYYNRAIIDSLEGLDKAHIQYKLRDFDTKKDALLALSTGFLYEKGDFQSMCFNGSSYNLILKNKALQNKILSLIKDVKCSNSGTISSEERIFYVEDTSTDFNIKEVLIFSDWQVDYINADGELQSSKPYCNLPFDELSDLILKEIKNIEEFDDCDIGLINNTKIEFN